MSDYRPELPPVPQRMRSLPIQRGYPVPWFVAMIDGAFHFPTADAEKMRQALRKHLCWVCGQQLGKYLSFVIGPMAVVNRHTSEPPCHHECAVFSAKACPFLVRPHMKRQRDVPEGAENPGGVFIERNPGVTAVWTTLDFWLRQLDNGVLVRLGEPTGVLWFMEGHAASRDQAQRALSDALPILHDIAKPEGERAMKELDHLYTKALGMLPT